MHARLLVLCLTLFVAGAWAAEPPAAEPNEAAAVETGRGESIGDLIHLNDLWHDANLKADSDQIAKWERRINEFLRADIEQTRWRYEVCRKQTEGYSSKVNGVPLSAEQLEVLDELADVDQWLKVKKRLLKGFENSQAFSNRYRLVGDYLQVLRMEHDQLQVKMAENQDPE